MAITQDRMMALITAARQCKDCALIFQRFISAEIKHLPSNPTLDEALSLVRAIQTLSLTNNIPMEAGEIIAREEEHFRLMATRNKRSAAYARRKRGTPDGALNIANPEIMGLKSPTAPLTLDRFKHADLQSIVQPHPSHPNQTQHQPAVWTSADDLIQNKLKINKIHADMNMKEPYDGVAIYDETIPLNPDHYQFLGLPRPEADDSLF
jgi:hypothetical protein